MTKTISTIFAIALSLLLFSACSQAAPQAVAPEPEVAAATTIAEPEATEPATAVPTSIPTEAPTETPAPTATTEPTPTATPEPSPTPDMTGGGSGKIIFVSSRDGEETFYMMNFDGSEQVPWDGNPLPETAVSRFAPRLSPDGSQFAGSAEIDGIRNIIVANTDGSDWQQITTNISFVASHPVWSPDGQQLAFDSNDNNGLYIVNKDGSALTPLLNNPISPKGFPSWSPDGSQIAFNWAIDLAADSPDDAEVFVINVDGTAVTPLTDNEFQDISPVWSPDGTRIAFHSDRDGNFEIYVMNADGSEQTRLTNNDINDFSPVWSPDGRQIAFSAQLRLEDDSYRPEVFVMNADGSNQRSLTPGQQGFNPYWLP